MEGIRYSTKEMCYFVSLYSAKQILLQFALQQTKCKYMYVVNHHKKLRIKSETTIYSLGDEFLGRVVDALQTST